MARFLYIRGVILCDSMRRNERQTSRRLLYRQGKVMFSEARVSHSVGRG